MRTEELSQKISLLFSQIYFHGHPSFDIELSHQAVRGLQYVQMVGPATIQQLADHLGCAQNTASEIIRRLRQKGLVEKQRRSDDERIVEVYLTDAGQEAVLQHTGLDIARLTTNLDQVSEEQRDRIEQGLLLLLEISQGRGEDT